MFAAQIPAPMFHITIPERDRDLWICDTAGFGDNRNIEIDISNGIGMMDAVQSCKSARFLILTAKDSLTANRSTMVKEIGNIVNKMFYNFEENMDKVLCLFNGFKEEGEITDFQKKLTNPENNKLLEKGHDTNLEAFIRLLMDNSTEENNYLFPLSGDYKKILKAIIKLDKLQDMNQLRHNFAEGTKARIKNYYQES